MDRFLGFGRRLWFVCRVMLGIEERNIRAQNIELQKKLMRMRERKAALERVPEQMILSEIRKVVEEMQKLNESLDKTEEAVQKLLEPVRKEAHLIMEAQLEKEENVMRELMQATYQNMPQGGAALSKEEILQQAMRATYEAMPQEKVEQNEEGTVSSDLSSVSHNREVTVEKEKKPQE